MCPDSGGSGDRFKAGVGPPGVFPQSVTSVPLYVGFRGIRGGEGFVVGVAPGCPSGVSGSVGGGPVLGSAIPVFQVISLPPKMPLGWVRG